MNTTNNCRAGLMLVGFIGLCLALTGTRLGALSIMLDAHNQLNLRCGMAQFAGFHLRQSEDLVHWSDTGLRFDPDLMEFTWGPPAQNTLFFRVEPDLSLELSSPAADATTIQLKWPPLSAATEYRVFRDGTPVGSTAGRVGH